MEEVGVVAVLFFFRWNRGESCVRRAHPRWCEESQMGNETEAVVLRCCVDLCVCVGIHRDCRYHQRWCVFYQRPAWWDKDLPEETKMFEVSHG